MGSGKLDGVLCRHPKVEKFLKWYVCGSPSVFCNIMSLNCPYAQQYFPTHCILEILLREILLLTARGHAQHYCLLETLFQKAGHLRNKICRFASMAQ